ncbi:MAG: hypothetical protein J6Y02_01145 [Pseudobutyrivibrio sp.]|nr:hypothetical protein [Pseudobutyrivibrio sp.]
MKLNLARLTGNIAKWSVKHTPEILHALGFAAGASAIVLTATGTVKAVRAYDEQQPATKKETFRVCGKYYIPAVGAAILATTCHCAAAKAYLKRNAMLTSCCTMAYDKISRLEEKNVEILGEKKAAQINGEVAESNLSKVDFRNIVNTGHGETLFYDEFIGQTFRSDWGYICSKINELNAGIANEIAYERGDRDTKRGRYPTIYDYEIELNLRQTNFCHHYMWCDGSLIRATVDYKTADNGEPIGIITHHTMPMVRPEYQVVYR